MNGKAHLLHKIVCFQIPKKVLKCFSVWMRNYLFLKNYVTSEGAFSPNVLYYKHISIARYQVNFYITVFMLLVITNSVQCL